jgi:phenylacetate-CoA ligase
MAMCGGRFRPKELYLGFETSNFRQVVSFYAAQTWLPRPRRTTVSMVAPVDDIAAAINREHPDVLVGYGGFLDDFYRAIAARGVDVHHPRVVIYVGERLSAERRQWIEATTGALVLSRYCAVEALKIGYFCEARRGFHLHEDLCDVAVVDAHGRRVPDGQAGEIVISNLVNHATVLLNYPMGDVAALEPPSACACGRTHRRLSEIHGRVEDRLRLADGRTLHPRAIWAALKDERTILRYQLVQHALDRYELRLTLDQAAELARLRDRLTPSLRLLFGATAAVAIVSVPDLGDDTRRASGKFRAVVSMPA